MRTAQDGEGAVRIAERWYKSVAAQHGCLVLHAAGALL